MCRGAVDARLGRRTSVLHAVGRATAFCVEARARQSAFVNDERPAVSGGSPVGCASGDPPAEPPQRSGQPEMKHRVRGLQPPVGLKVGNEVEPAGVVGAVVHPAQRHDALGRVAAAERCRLCRDAAASTRAPQTPAYRPQRERNRRPRRLVLAQGEQAPRPCFPRIARLVAQAPRCLCRHGCGLAMAAGVNRSGIRRGPTGARRFPGRARTRRRRTA